MLDEPLGWLDKDGDPIDTEQAFELRYDFGATGDGALSEYARIGFDQIDNQKISTVWLGINHQFLPDRPPLIFETMIFGGAFDGECDRYSTQEQAREGHCATVAALKAGRIPPWLDDPVR